MKCFPFRQLLPVLCALWSLLPACRIGERPDTAALLTGRWKLQSCQLLAGCGTVHLPAATWEFGSAGTGRFHSGARRPDQPFRWYLRQSAGSEYLTIDGTTFQVLEARPGRLRCTMACISGGSACLRLYTFTR
ncbi:MAG TPA: hypothetical protein VHK69_16575 [Chitinophagaceae bacterium]|jgi:hypothetical protein|nr:hypothetical protein [Chitinophagaceae bacterium]